MRCRPSVLVAALAIVAVAACGSEEPPVTRADYVEALGSICAGTTGELDALPDPPEQISVTDFATSAANLLDAEAEQARRLEPPEELDADHRAFVRNTDEQAAAWRSVAAADGDVAVIGDLTTQIGQLVLGRNDLSDEMGVADCRRGDG